MDLKLEDVKKFLAEDAEGKAYVEELVSSETEGLKTKNNELLGKLKKTKEANNKLESDMVDFKEKYDELENAKTTKSNDVAEALAKQAEKHQKELDKANQRGDIAEGKVKSLLVDNGLNNALIAANVSKDHIPAVEAFLKSTNNIEITEDENDSPIAVVGDIPLSDFVTNWASSDAGKIYVSAPNNSGGGALGSGGDGGGKGADLSTMSPTEKLNHARSVNQG